MDVREKVCRFVKWITGDVVRGELRNIDMLLRLGVGGGAGIGELATINKMKNMNDKLLNLELLKNGLSDCIIASLGAMMSDCAIYSFYLKNHKTGVVLEVKTDISKKNYNVVWESNPILMQKSMNDKNRTTDFGAMGIAILLALDLTEYTVFETSQTGTGVDFWLSKESEELDFSQGARLEISGISQKTRTNNIEYRLNKKKKQVKKSSSSGQKAYISITEFGKPESAFLTE